MKENFKENFDFWLKGVLESLNMRKDAIPVITDIVFLILLTAASVILYFLLKIIIMSILMGIAAKTKNTWDNQILSGKSVQRALKIIPAIAVYAFLYVMPSISGIIEIMLIVYISLMSYFTLAALLDSFNIIYDKNFVGVSRKPIKGFITVVKFILFSSALIIIVSKLINQSPVYILSGLGALSAITMLIFKDSMLGMVAGFQMSSNDLVRIGDWIEVPKYEADGNVIDVSLTFVKVKNWDNTITTIPAYALVSDSFKNWRGMFASGGRRIKRSINIDASTVKFCSQQMLDNLMRVELLKNYLTERLREIEEYNKNRNIDTNMPVNGRRLTNIGVFRRYITEYLKNHSKIHKEMAIMVRQLSSGKEGIPLEIYAFTNDTKWINYEEIMSDIFDHLFAVIKYFELKVFQEPSGSDIQSLKFIVNENTRQNNRYQI